VAAFRLNVREAPNPTAAILTRINRNEVYPIIARNSSGTWYQINANGIIGWVSAGFIVIANGANVPVVGAGVPAPTPAPTTPPPVVSPTGITATASTSNVNIRQGPGTSFSRVGLLPRGQAAAVLGRSADNAWWQIEFGGIRGWVSARFVTLNSGANVNSLPITG
jgi:N-acetylmuramoyl-L-alanine amidase